MTRNNLCLIIMTCIMLLFIPSKSLATETFTSDADDFISTGKEQLEEGKGTAGELDQSQVKGVSDFVYNLFFAIGVAATVIIGLVLGIKFVTAGVEGKAKVKESLIAYFIGCIIIFCAYGIWKLLISILSNLD